MSNLHYERLKYLLLKRLSGGLTPEEDAELAKMLEASPQDQSAVDFFRDEEKVKEAIRETAEAEERVWQRISEGAGIPDPGNLKTNTPRSGKLVKLFLRVVTAAAAIVLAFFVWTTYRTAPAVTPEIAMKQQDVKAPENVRAMVTLADGRKVPLDSLQSGWTASQGTVMLVKKADGSLAYEMQSDGEAPGAMLTYNTIDNPRGSKVVEFVLADGSRVWLNAGSSIQFPVAFMGKERRVTLQGEAYFDVVRQTAQPFLVDVGKGFTVEVLGTQFNVFAFEEEETAVTTLVQGKVKLTAGNSSDKSAQVLAPGQQAAFSRDAGTHLVKDPDVERAIAWKNGKFDFGESTEIRTVMRELARWYDLDVRYTDNRQHFIGGAISRTVSLANVLKMLEMTGVVELDIQGRTVVVSSKK